MEPDNWPGIRSIMACPCGRGDGDACPQHGTITVTLDELAQALDSELDSFGASSDGAVRELASNVFRRLEKRQ